MISRGGNTFLIRSHTDKKGQFKTPLWNESYNNPKWSQQITINSTKKSTGALSQSPTTTNRKIRRDCVLTQVGSFHVAGYSSPGLAWSNTMNLTVPIGTLWQEQVLVGVWTGPTVVVAQTVLGGWFGLGLGGKGGSSGVLASFKMF